MTTSIGNARYSARGKRQRTWAWWSLFLLPASFGLAFATGEAVATLLAPNDNVQPPVWLMAVALALAAMVFASPLLVTWFFSDRAARAGQPGAWLPLSAGGIVVGVFIQINLASALTVLLLG